MKQKFYISQIMSAMESALQLKAYFNALLFCLITPIVFYPSITTPLTISDTLTC